jgi:hypothetical protein
MISVKGSEIKYRSVFLPIQWYIYIWYLVAFLVTVPILLVSRFRQALIYDTKKHKKDVEDIEAGTEASSTSPMSLGNDTHMFERKKTSNNADRQPLLEHAEPIKRKSEEFECSTVIVNFFKSIALVTGSIFGTFILTLIYWNSF